MEEKKYKALFAGTPEFAVPAVGALLRLPAIDVVGVLTQPDRPVGRGRRLGESPVKRYALQQALPVYQPSSTRSKEFMDLFHQLKVDVVVLTAYGEIISPELLSLPPHGWVNIHASLLPKLRGASPIQQALLDGEDHTGVTLMSMVQKLDEGPIIAQLSVPIDHDETTGTLHDKLAAAGARILAQHLVAYLQGRRTPTEQYHLDATYCKKISTDKAHIDWKAPAEGIDRLVRAMNPSPGAFTHLAANRVKILSVKPLGRAYQALAGTLAEVNGGLAVSTGTTPLAVLKLQLPGKRPVSGEEFIRGYRGHLPTVLA